MHDTRWRGTASRPLTVSPLDSCGARRQGALFELPYSGVLIAVPT